MLTSMSLRVLPIALASSGLLCAAAFWPTTPAQASPQASQGDAAQFYTTKVQPILDTRAGMMKGGHDGTVLVPGHPEQSLLIKLIRHEGPADDPMPMPPKSKLSDADIATITQWVQAGAVME